jgi:hypothetical protein
MKGRLSEKWIVVYDMRGVAPGDPAGQVCRDIALSLIQTLPLELTCKSF